MFGDDDNGYLGLEPVENNKIFVPYNDRQISNIRSKWWNLYNVCSIMTAKLLHLFYRQLDFPSEPGVANEILENDAKNCLTVA